MFYKLDLKKTARHNRKQIAFGAMPAVWDVGGIISPANGCDQVALPVLLCLNFWNDFLPKIWGVILQTLRPM